MRERFTCDCCGWNQDDYAATGHFRCDGCLEAAFVRMPVNLLAWGGGRRGGSGRYRGTRERILADLCIGVRVAVKEENYELAGVLLDALRTLEKRFEELGP